MLIYNKKLYLTFRDFNQFYVFQLPEGNEKCFQRLFQVGKETNSYYILGKSGKMYPYDQKQFLKNASDLLMFAISKSYFDSSKIFHIDIEDFCHYILNYCCIQADDPTVHMNFPIPVLGNEIMKMTFPEFVANEWEFRTITDTEAYVVAVSFDNGVSARAHWAGIDCDGNKEMLDTFFNMIAISANDFILRMNEYQQLEKFLQERQDEIDLQTHWGKEIFTKKDLVSYKDRISEVEKTIDYEKLNKRYLKEETYNKALETLKNAYSESIEIIKAIK